MKQTFLHVGKEKMLLELVQNPTYGLNVRLVWFLGINQDVIQIYNNKNIQLFSQNNVDVSVKDGGGIE